MTFKINSSDGKTGVNKDRNGINGLIIAEEGEFKSGRGRFSLASLEKIVELGNAAKGGIRKRAQHPTLLDDGLGSGVGRETNYRIDKRENGNHVVRADMLFSKAGMEMNPKGATPWGAYLMSELEENSSAFQNSIVLKYRIADGDASSVPLWMPTELQASDFVSSGDAVHGDSLGQDRGRFFVDALSSARESLRSVDSTLLSIKQDIRSMTIKQNIQSIRERCGSGVNPETVCPVIDRSVAALCEQAGIDSGEFHGLSIDDAMKKLFARLTR